MSRRRLNEKTNDRHNQLIKPEAIPLAIACRRKNLFRIGDSSRYLCNLYCDDSSKQASACSIVFTTLSTRPLALLMALRPAQAGTEPEARALLYKSLLYK